MEPQLSLAQLVVQDNMVVMDDAAPPRMTSDSSFGSARLTELLAVEDLAPVQQVEAAQPVDPAAIASVPPTAPTGKNTLGDSILGTLDGVGKRYLSAVDRAHKDLNTTATSTDLASLLSMQLKIAALSLEIEVVSKGVAKATQHFDQLTKLQ